MKTFSVMALALALAGPAVAAPNLAQTTQKGSLLIFPDIDVRDSRQTIVRIQNDGPRDVQVKCHYLDAFKHRVDMQFGVTANQPFWFDAATGDGTEHVTPYPSTPSNGFANTDPKGAGMLACWVVDLEGTNQVKWNHLAGTATVINHITGAAYEYGAYAFYAATGSDLAPVGTPGTIRLDGVQYDSCPLYMIGQFSPGGTEMAQDLFYATTRVAFVGCNIALQQDWRPAWTKLQFDVWNEEENKITGTFECADTWHELYFISMPLSLPGYPPVPFADAASSHFSIGAVGTRAARYRVQGQNSLKCLQEVFGLAFDVGVLAIQSTDLLFVNPFALAKIGTNLTAAGKLPTGKITWDPGFVTPEGGIR